MSDVGAALPKPRIDILPALTPLIVAALVAPFIGSFSTFATLTLASLAMGAMLFTMASGLTLAFGMMDVLNFGHGAFIAVGAFVATVVYALAAPLGQGSLALDLGVFALALVAAAAVCGAPVNATAVIIVIIANAATPPNRRKDLCTCASWLPCTIE